VKHWMAAAALAVLAQGMAVSSIMAAPQDSGVGQDAETAQKAGSAHGGHGASGPDPATKKAAEAATPAPVEPGKKSEQDKDAPPPEADASSAPATASPLVEAAREGDTAKAIELIEQRVDVNAAGADGTTPLIWAAHNGDVELVKRLIKAKANVAATNSYGATAMTEAAERADVEVLKALLAGGADVESPNAEGQTALMTVVRTNRVEAAKLLISRGADVNAREKWRGQTPLMWAAAQSQPEMVKLLIRHRADVNARSTVRKWERDVTAEPRAQNRPRGGFTPLLLAAREGCVECAKVLVEAKADINLASPDGISPLLMAVLNGRFDLASYLIDAGANVDKWDWWGRSPLYSAVDYNTVPRGGRPDRPSADQTTALQLTEKLLKAGANPNLQLKLFPPYRALGPDRGADMMLGIGATPLIRAAKAGDNDSIRLLLQHGALVDLPNATGITPLMAAAGVGSSTIDTRGRFRTEAECIETAKILLAAGAKINATRDNGQTALHGAAQWGWNGFVQFLADNGINVHAADRNGIKAIDVALGKGNTTGRLGIGTAQAHPETAALLEKLAQRSPPVDTASLNTVDPRPAQ
jgi:uncharacterized protein